MWPDSFLHQQFVEFYCNFQSINAESPSLLLYSSVKQKRYNIKSLQGEKNTEFSADFMANPEHLLCFPSKNMK